MQDRFRVCLAAIFTCSIAARAHAQVEDGLSQIKEGHLVKAKAAFAKAVADNPNDIEALHDLGIVDLALADPGSAQEAFSKEIDISHDKKPEE